MVRRAACFRLLPFAFCLLPFFLSFSPPAFGQTGPAPVVVAPVVERDVRQSRTLVGSVLPVRASVVGSDVEGRVTAFLVRAGDRVEAGNPLARLRTRHLEIEMAAAGAELTLRVEQLAELENGARPEEVEQGRARAAAAEAEQAYWIWRVKSTTRLLETRAVSEDIHQQALLSRDLARERVREAKAALALLLAGTRSERVSQQEARVQAQREEMARLQDLLGRHVIEAPFGGYVVRELTETGQWLARGGPVAEIAQLDEVEVRVALPEDQVRGVVPGAPAGVLVSAYPERRFEGEVVAVVPQADPRSRTFPVRIRVPNSIEEAGPVLRGGMSCRVALPVGEVGRSLLVPKDALVLGGSGAFLMVVVPAAASGSPETVRPVAVEPGIAVGSWVQVSGGVRAGDKVVVRGNERIFPGQPIRVAEEIDPPAEAGGQ